MEDLDRGFAVSVREEWLHDEDLLVFEIKPRTFGQAEHEEADVEIEPQWPEGEPNIGFARAHRSA